MKTVKNKDCKVVVTIKREIDIDKLTRSIYGISLNTKRNCK